MSEDLTTLPPEFFLRLAVERGGLNLDEVTKDLSPEAAEALRLIVTFPLSTDDATRSAPTRGITTETSRPASRHRCPACGHASQARDRFCRRCGQRLERLPSGPTLADLVAHGRLTSEQAEKLRETIEKYQNHYTAGTRYSVFGARQSLTPQQAAGHGGTHVPSQAGRRTPQD